MPTSKARKNIEYQRNKKEAEVKTRKFSMFPMITMTDHTPFKTTLIPVSS